MIRILLNSEVFTENYVNWNEITDTLSRSKECYGVMISQTLSIELIGNAYKAIKNLEDADDIAAQCTIERQRYDNSDGWVTDFSGYVDFTTTEYNTKYTQVENTASKSSLNSVTFSAYSSNFSNDILERSDVKIPYDRLETLDGETIAPFANEYYEVDIEGIEVVSKGNGVGDEVEYFVPSGQSGWIPSNGVQSNNEDIQNVIFRTMGSPIGSGFDPVSTDLLVRARSLTTGTISMYLNYRFDDNPNVGYNFYTRVGLFSIAANGDLTQIDADGNPSTTYFLYDNTVVISPAQDPYDNNETIELSIELEEDQGILLWQGYSGLNYNTKYTLYEDSTFDISLIQKDPATPCNFVPPFEMGQRIIESYTGQTNGLDSPFLGRTDSPVTYSEDGEGSLFFQTNGRLIRQFPTGYQTTDENKVAQLALSFNDWFNSLNTIFCLGAGVKYEDGQYKLYVDDRREFFKTDIIFELDKSDIELDTFEKVKDLDLFYNEIEVGSTYEQPEEVSGLEEYNSKQNYSSPVRNESKLDLICPSIYAAYPFEFARRKPFDAEETTDYKYDNNNFIFNVERNGGNYKQLSDTDFDEINGLNNVTTYINLNITPKRNLDRFGWWINAGFKGYQNSDLKYNKSDIVTDLSTRKIDEADAIVENADVLISDLDTPILTGRIVRFSGALTPNNFKTAQSNPYGLIAYPDLITGQTGYGLIREISTNIVDKKTNYELWEALGVVDGENYRLLQDGNYRLLESGGIRLLED